MKKLIVGLAAVGGIVALRAAAERGGHKMSEHCKSMGAKCKEMMASQSGQTEAPGMRERCQQQFVGSDEAVPV